MSNEEAITVMFHRHRKSFSILLESSANVFVLTIRPGVCHKSALKH